MPSSYLLDPRYPVLPVPKKDPEEEVLPTDIPGVNQGTRLAAEAIARSQLPINEADPELPSLPAAETLPPVRLPTAKTTEYPDMPERDWAAEFKAARSSGDRDRNVNELMRAIAGIGSSISGVKRDDAFFDRMGKEADRYETNLAKDFELDALARKARAGKVAGDPTSPQNRRAQEVFARLYGGLARGNEDLIRGMTAAELSNMLTENTKYTGEQGKLLDARFKAALAAGKELTRRAEKKADQGIAEYNAITQRMRALDPAAPLRQTPEGEDRVAVSSAQNKISQYISNPRNQKLRDMAGTLAAMEGQYPGILQASPQDLDKMNLDPMLKARAREVFPGLVSLFDESADQTQRNEDILNMRRTLETIRQNELYGTALSEGERRQFESLVGRQWTGDMGAAVRAIQIFHKGLQRKAREIDVALKNATRAAPSVYREYYNEGGLMHQNPVFGKYEYGSGATAGGKPPTETPPTTPPPTTTRPKLVTPRTGSGTPEDPFIYTYDNGDVWHQYRDPATGKIVKEKEAR